MSNEELKEPNPPVSDLAKLLYVIAQEVGSINPQAFKEVDIVKALKQADAAGNAHPSVD